MLNNSFWWGQALQVRHVFLKATCNSACFKSVSLQSFLINNPINEEFLSTHLQYMYIYKLHYIYYFIYKLCIFINYSCY